MRLCASTLMLASLMGFVSCGDDEPDTVAEDNQKVAEYVDLGLPSGTLWATCNVCAKAPEETGGFYAWGELQTKAEYAWATYKWMENQSITKYKKETFDTTTEPAELELTDDVAYQLKGSEWRTPSEEQWSELINECTFTATTKNGVKGLLVAGKKNNVSIFLPIGGGYMSGTGHGDEGMGFYWSRTVNLRNDRFASCISFIGGANAGGSIQRDMPRAAGANVRPVRLSK